VQAEFTEKTKGKISVVSVDSVVNDSETYKISHFRKVVASVTTLYNGLGGPDDDGSGAFQDRNGFSE
jgi:hypothetical protein